MPSILRFLLRRLALIPVTLIIITMLIYAGVMLTPPEARVQLYLPKGNARIRESTIEAYIKTNKLDQPYWVQYTHWAGNLLAGNWGFSPSLGEDVLPGLLARTPVTLELLFYSFLVTIPTSLVLGSLAGTRMGSWLDRAIRAFSFLGTSVPLFILSVFALAIFYIKLGWFAPERISIQFASLINSPKFTSYTGFITLDSLMNGNLEMFKDALSHLILPVTTLSIYNIASLTYLNRTFTSEEIKKLYVIAARARGLRESAIRYGHILRATLSRSLTSIGLAAATILMGVFVTEMIYTINGISSFIVKAMRTGSDAPATLGFMIYSVILVLILMLFMDLLVAFVDPRAREEILDS